MTRSILISVAIAATMLAGAKGASDNNPTATVATVGNEPIQAAEARKLVAEITRGRNIREALLPHLQAQVLEELIARRLVLAYAQRTGSAATEAEIEATRAQLKSRLAARRQTLADLLKAESMGEADLRRQLSWNIVWEKFRSRYMTPQRAEAYFEAHRRELDGTEIAVSHILLRPSAGGGPAALDEVTKQAEVIRREITAEKLPFAEAARKHSAGPSREDGGRLGFIGRHGPMDETFSRAAFALDVGQVSQPVRTPFGIHLIRCDESRPGGKRLSDVRKEVEDALARELLDKLSQIQRRLHACEIHWRLAALQAGHAGSGNPTLRGNTDCVSRIWDACSQPTTSVLGSAFITLGRPKDTFQ